MIKLSLQIDGFLKAITNRDQAAIEAQGMLVESFPEYENILDTLVNIELPNLELSGDING